MISISDIDELMKDHTSHEPCIRLSKCLPELLALARAGSELRKDIDSAWGNTPSIIDMLAKFDSSIGNV